MLQALNPPVATEAAWIQDQGLLGRPERLVQVGLRQQAKIGQARMAQEHGGSTVALEIERRFLVTGEGWRPHVRRCSRLRQGYLAASPEGVTVRVRLREASPSSDLETSPEEGRQGWLTLKADAGGFARHEFEYLIPPADAEGLLELASHQLRKWRYGLDLPGGDWVLDRFEAENAPLQLVEVELESEDQAVVVPPWCGREITDRPELSNAALARRPLSHWPAAERQHLIDDLMRPGDGGGPGNP